MAVQLPRLYVGNLPYVGQKADVEKLFADNAVAIKNVDISIDSFTGRNPSYCFVDFHSQDDADNALEKLQGHVVRGWPVMLKSSTQRRETSTRSQQHKRTGVPAVDFGTQSPYVYDRWSGEDVESRGIAPSEEGRRVWVGGLPAITHQADANVEMRGLFHGRNIRAVSKVISPSDSDRTKVDGVRYCIVDLPSKQEAEDAVKELDGTATTNGGTYKVRIARLLGRPTKVMREQLGIMDVDSELPRSPKCGLESNWRRSE